MRWIFSFSLLVLPTAATAQDNDAEKLYRSFQKKLTEAKAFKVAFEINVPKSLQYKGDLTMAAGNKLRISGTGTQDTKPDSWTIVSNGEKIGLKHDKEGRKRAPEFAATPEKLTAYFTGHLLKGGVLLATQDLSLRRLAENSPDDVVLGGFKISGKEKIGDRETQVLEYTAQYKSGKLTCKLWLDITTNMPLKRVVGGDREFRSEELYANWELNPKLKDDEFTLPK